MLATQLKKKKRKNCISFCEVKINLTALKFRGKIDHKVVRKYKWIFITPYSSEILSYYGAEHRNKWKEEWVWLSNPSQLLDNWRQSQEWAGLFVITNIFYMFVDYLHRQPWRHRFPIVRTEIKDKILKEHAFSASVISIIDACDYIYFILSLNLCDCVCSYIHLSYAVEYACTYEYNFTYICVCPLVKARRQTRQT